MSDSSERQGWDWNYVWLVIGCCVLTAALCIAGRWVARIAIMYFQRQEFIKARIIGLPLRRKRKPLWYRTTVGLIELLEWSLWCLVSKVVHRALRWTLVGGARPWLWCLARVVLAPACVLHFSVAVLLLATIESGTHHTKPFVLGSAFFFFVWAGAELLLFACVRKPRTITQLTWFVRFASLCLVWDAIACGMLHAGSLLGPVVTVHCLEVRNVPLFRLYRFIRAAYVELRDPAGCAAAPHGACSLQALLGVGANETVAGQRGLPHELGACLLCAVPDLGGGLRASAAGGLWAEYANRGQRDARGFIMDLNPMRNISTAYGRANLNLCTASQGPSASMNSSDIVSLLGCDAALQCDSVAPCVECAVGAPSDVPLLPLLLILVRLLAITAALELRQDLERVSQAPDAAMELRRLDEVQRKDAAIRRLGNLAVSRTSTPGSRASARSATKTIQVQPRQTSGDVHRTDFGITVGAAQHIKLELAAAYAAPR